MRRFRADEMRALALRTLFVLLAVTGVVGLMILLPRYVADLGFAIVPVLALAFAAILALVLVPVEWLPAIALGVFALVPARLLSQEGALGALPITSFVIVVWAGRRLVQAYTSRRRPLPSATLGRRRPSPLAVATSMSALLFLAWCVFSLLRSSEAQTSTGWLISFTAGALLPLAVANSQREAALVSKTWMLLGAVLGGYASLEFAIGANPIWGTVYTLLGAGDSQHWSVYRAEASFGHPLFASLFFAVACALAIGAWLTSRDRWTLAAGIFSGLGLVATVSRGALIGGVVALTLAYLAALVMRGEKRWNRLALLAVLAVVSTIGLLQFDALAARNDSVEAERSAFARDLGLVVALQAARISDFLGTGPGTSGITARLIDDVVIENSGLQLLISVGIPGLILFVALIGFAIAHALHRRAIGVGAALVAYAVCIAGFNAIDALRPMHLLLGLLLLMAMNTPRRASDPPGARSPDLEIGAGTGEAPLVGLSAEMPRSTASKISEVPRPRLRQVPSGIR